MALVPPGLPGPFLHNCFPDGSSQHVLVPGSAQGFVFLLNSGRLLSVRFSSPSQSWMAAWQCCICCCSQLCVTCRLADKQWRCQRGRSQLSPLQVGFMVWITSSPWWIRADYSWCFSCPVILRAWWVQRHFLILSHWTESCLVNWLFLEEHIMVSLLLRFSLFVTVVGAVVDCMAGSQWMYRGYS